MPHNARPSATRHKPCHRKLDNLADWRKRRKMWREDATWRRSLSAVLEHSVSTPTGAKYHRLRLLQKAWKVLPGSPQDSGYCHSDCPEARKEGVWFCSVPSTGSSNAKTLQLSSWERCTKRPVPTDTTTHEAHWWGESPERPLSLTPDRDPRDGRVCSVHCAKDLEYRSLEDLRRGFPTITLRVCPKQNVNGKSEPWTRIWLLASTILREVGYFFPPQKDSANQHKRLLIFQSGWNMSSNRF